MDINNKFRLVKDHDTKNMVLEYWIKYGENKDEWLCADTIPNLTVDDLKMLRDYINHICNKNLI